MSSYYLGADVSKGYSDFVMLDGERKVADKNFQFDDTHDGHEKLTKYLESFVLTHRDSTICAAVESTGGYEDNWYERLRELSGSLPVRVARLNPTMVKANSEAELRRTKTDAVSARDIAEYLIAHPDKVRYNEPYYRTLRRQWTLIELNIKQVTQLRNQLDSVLYSSMPELLTFCRHGMPDWLLRLLKDYPTYRKITEAGYEKLMTIAYVSEEKALRVTELVKNGVGKSDDVSGDIISTLSKQILRLEEDIESEKKRLEHNYRESGECVEEIEILRTFQGIGVYSAVGLMLNIGSIDFFDSAKKLASFFGVHPKFKQSGDGTWGNHMSKEGRSQPRAILFMVAISAIQHNPVIKKTYAGCLARGMNRMAAIGVCMHKILRIVYGMLKNKKSFDPKVDEVNTRKVRRTVSVQKLDTKRRMQNFDSAAPVSRRQHKKREEQTAKSQGKQVAMCGIEEPAPHSKLANRQ